MSSGCVRWLLNHTMTSMFGAGIGYCTSASRSYLICTVRSSVTASSCTRTPFCTAAGSSENPPVEKRKATQDLRARASVTAVGRKIPQRQIQVISDTGENMGTMHRADVIRLMDEKGFRLVLLSEQKDPPLYKLMTGKQIHDEQLKRREKQKSKAAPAQVKELTFTHGIAAHDLTVKVKQIESWLEKNNHIRVTLRAKRGQPADNLETALEEVVHKVGVMVGFVSKPKVVRDGQAAMCILRPPSAKELSQKGKSSAADLQTAGSGSSQDKSVAGTDAAGASVQE
ncbi:translation initiation factor IF-3, mitochondrial [Takifugu rubripes]|uniref:translation initiation factor IF-3, mitochondrial n=1 Tax=Takifugu rubripes TaxID=31033 RepID=UPI001145ACB1|nr:translation initiation factor IF-3, mitochondrial [Takifugu rubripes]